ncbi:hypothetical protein [Clostridium sp. Marseille-P299]|uniref:hypothetical protein n=1 Tax=Clostridium sp. Marseille-P299 TaxID=1805477 RepID=UPI000836A097|nr:hypothetical protein [Clostridium sp. Marseille-P299]
MLTKLTKYEWMATARYMIPLYIVLAFITIFTKIALTLSTGNRIVFALSNILFVLYIISIIVIAVTTFLLIIMRFYKNLLTGEGYLMFTLPVKVHDLINAKLIISILWGVLSILICFFSLLLVIPSCSAIIPNASSFTLSTFFNMFTDYGIGKTVLLLLLFLMILVYNILTFYASIAIGQNISSNKVFGSLIAYICIYTICQMFAGLLLLAAMLFKIDLNDEKLMITVATYLGLIISTIGSIVFYTIINNTLKKHLNLE